MMQRLLISVCNHYRSLCSIIKTENGQSVLVSLETALKLLPTFLGNLKKVLCMISSSKYIRAFLSGNTPKISCLRDLMEVQELWHKMLAFLVYSGQF